MDAFVNFFKANSSVFAVVGATFCSYVALKIVLHILRAVRSFFLAPLLNLGVNPLKLGQWAVVTGATDGIGKAYATALAKKGMNVVLVSRTESKLKATAEEISAVSKVEIKTVTADFSGGLELYEGIREQLDGLDIGVLINNVGMSYEYPEYVHLVANRDETFNRLLHINIFSVTFMTTMLLPQMVSKGKGAIVNIGSASCFGFPLLTVYAASKAYVDSFSKNLAAEYERNGILVQSVMPGFVATKMTGVRKTSSFIPSPDTYVRTALATLGLEQVTFGYWSHWLLMVGNLTFKSLMPKTFDRKIIQGLERVRDRQLKRLAAKKSE